MRLGEILNLRWQDLDFSSRFIFIRESKNGSGRPVPMDATLTALFFSYPRRPGTDLIFASTRGTKLTDIHVGFKNACRRADIVDLRFHDLRHAYASLFVSSGGDIFVLRSLLGHRGIQMTTRYAHLSPAYQLATVARMDKVWKRDLRKL
jgi:integrase/recombinase XerD